MNKRYSETYDGWIREIVAEGMCIQFRPDAQSEEAQRYRTWLEEGNEPDYFPSPEEAMLRLEEAGQ